MKIYWNAKFFAHTRRNVSGNVVTIRMRLTLRGEPPLDFATGFSIPPECWDAKAQKALPPAPDSDEINRTINTWRATISEAMSRYEIIEKRRPARAEIRDLFNDLIGRDTPLKRLLDDKEGIEFFPCLDLFMQKNGKKNQWSRATYQKFENLKRHLADFDPLLSFYNLNENRMQDFVSYLTRIGMRNTTISKNLDFFRWFLRWAHLSGYYADNLYQTFRPKLKGVSGTREIVYLTQEELKRVENRVFEPHSTDDCVRDVFLFCCFTGLRYSDVAKLKRTDIKGDRIDVVTQKTVDSLHIELNDHSRAILQKYADYHFPNGNALPVFSNSQMNSHLKDIGKACGLDEPTRIVYFLGNSRREEVLPKWRLLTTHVARRTFVVTALQLGIPAEVIMRWTGHSSYETMKPYVAIVDDLKKRSMSKFNTI